MAIPILTCRTCKYWKEDMSNVHVENGRRGQCKRYPPQMLIPSPGQLHSMQPVTPIDDYCGEHKVKI